VNFHLLPRRVPSTGPRQPELECRAAEDGGAPPTLSEKINLLKWHLDRYDRLRASTANRASVILSATAILSAGNAVVFSQLLSGSRATTMPKWLVATFAVAVLGSAVMIVLSLIRASRVLVTSRDSRSLFAVGDDIPDGLLFNGTDTVRRIERFTDFQEAFSSHGHQEILTAAQVELWFTIHQHRHRYAQLRLAARGLRWSAVLFLAVLAGAILASLIGHF
jgi:hypothetical protein